MQQRRYRPGDVLDDYCPRERRITDHAIVAMIDDRIKQTRCVVCDAEHEYKDGKVPPQRRKKPQAALFSQVLDGLNGPQRPARVAAQTPLEDVDDDVSVDAADTPDVPHAEDVDEALPMVASETQAADTAGLDLVTPTNRSGDVASVDAVTEVEAPPREEGPWRRQLIRAALPRPEGQQPPATRPAPEFTVRQPTNARGHRHGRRRGGGGGGGSFAASSGNGNHGPMRFGRSGQGQSQGQGGRRRRGRGGKKNN
jgi:hypothetical protein